MEDSLTLFLVAVALGAYAQSVTGFALGIFVLGAVAVLGISSIAVTATALNIMSVAVGVSVALPRLRDADWKIVGMITCGLLPAMVLGVLALRYLSTHAEAILRLFLGLLIIAGGIILVWRPEPRETLSSTASFVSMGAIGGVLGGLFSVPAPALVYQLYRQPLPIHSIRTSLIVLFATLGIGRLIVVGLEGNVTAEVLRLGLLSVPVVLLASWLGVRLPPRISDLAMRRSVFVLLMITGGFIILTALPQ